MSARAVPVNILDYLQIPHFCLMAQTRLPVLDAPASRPLSKLPADTMLADLQRLGSRTDLVASQADAAARGGNSTCVTPAARYHTIWGLSTGRGCRCCTELALLLSQVRIPLATT